MTGRERERESERIKERKFNSTLDGNARVAACSRSCMHVDLEITCLRVCRRAPIGIGASHLTFCVRSQLCALSEYTLYISRNFAENQVDSSRVECVPDVSLFFRVRSALCCCLNEGYYRFAST